MLGQGNMQQYVADRQTFGGFHGWIAPYNDGSSSNLISTAGQYRFSRQVPNPPGRYSYGTFGAGGLDVSCNCDQVTHQTFTTPSVFAQIPGGWDVNACTDPYCNNPSRPSCPPSL